MGGDVSMPGGTLRGSDQGVASLAFSLPNQRGKPSQLLSQVLHPQRPTLGHVGHGGIGRRLAEKRIGRGEGSSRTRGVGEEERAYASPTRAWEACWAPRPGPPTFGD